MENHLSNPLGYEPLPKLLRSFAVPSVIAMLVSSLYNIVDQIFIGQGVGYLGNAATNVAYPLTTICLAIALLIGIGSASRFSLSLGAGEPEQAARVVGNAIAMMAVLGILYALLVELFLHPLLLAFGATPDVMPYAIEYTRITALGMPLLIVTNAMSNLARADGSPKYSMTCMLVGAVINTILDPIFIFVFHQGVAGAALATVIGQFFSFLLAVRYAFRFQHINLRREHLRLSLSESLQTASLGMSSSLNQVAITFVQIVINNSLTHYGASSIYGTDIPLAACGIVMKTNAILLAVVIGISQGSQPIIGFNYGAKQYDRVRGIYRLAIGCNLVVSLVGFLLFQFCPRQIISIFGSGNALYFEFAVRFMRIFLFMVLVNGVQMLSSSFFSAIGKPVKGLVLSMTRQVLFLIPLLLLLPILMGGIDGILFAGPVADTMAFLTTVCLVSREMKRIRGLEAQNAG
ncbi:MATE family efflux transporter [Pseudoflavonifractor sp. DSM 107456]|uniref:Multidrug export protein MepA n=1 Tax=Pseudoflavonifractor gallinarum TaxID=2779352 RepID=A0ABR9R7D9_9FIRM|nr:MULTISPECIES: MATE family efflux transporter [Pseudoflavonifractor]MBE5054584.1 MATE family efflux transporter [Pseudoflavonifractor gallinarum]MBT9685832.1 MATE family efflux transporter [Pseudoflavonifractor sp. MCC625]